MVDSKQSWGAMALFLMVMMGNAITIALVRHLIDLGGYSPFQLVFITHAIGALLCLPFWRGQMFRIEATQTRLLVLRAALEFVSFSAAFYAISQLPLPMHTALMFMSPIFGSLIALWVLREQGTLVAYGCIVAGFVGMLVITRPDQFQASLIWGASFSLLAALGFAVCAAVIKLLTRDAPPRRIARNMLWMTSCFAAPFAWMHWQPIPLDHLPFFAALGMLAFGLQHTVAMALARVPLMTVIPLNFFQLVVVSIIAWLAFDETVKGETIIGSIIILAATIVNVWYGSRHARQMAAKAEIAAAEAENQAA